MGSTFWRVVIPLRFAFPSPPLRAAAEDACRGGCIPSPAARPAAIVERGEEQHLTQVDDREGIRTSVVRLDGDGRYAGERAGVRTWLDRAHRVGSTTLRFFFCAVACGVPVGSPAECRRLGHLAVIGSRVGNAECSGEQRACEPDAQPGWPWSARVESSRGARPVGAFSFLCILSRPCGRLHFFSVVVCAYSHLLDYLFRAASSPLRCYVRPLRAPSFSSFLPMGEAACGVLAGSPAECRPVSGSRVGWGTRNAVGSTHGRARLRIAGTGTDTTRGEARARTGRRCRSHLCFGLREGNAKTGTGGIKRVCHRRMWSAPVDVRVQRLSNRGTKTLLPTALLALVSPLHAMWFRGWARRRWRARQRYSASGIASKTMHSAVLDAGARLARHAGEPPARAWGTPLASDASRARCWSRTSLLPWRLGEPEVVELLVVLCVSSTLLPSRLPPRPPTLASPPSLPHSLPLPSLPRRSILPALPCLTLPPLCLPPRSSLTDSRTCFPPYSPLLLLGISALTRRPHAASPPPLPPALATRRLSLPCFPPALFLASRSFLRLASSPYSLLAARPSSHPPVPASRIPRLPALPLLPPLPLLPCPASTRPPPTLPPSPYVCDLRTRANLSPQAPPPPPPAQALVHRPGPPRAREAPPTDKALHDDDGGG
ncbi:hypothetical protein B0H13DRAFT_2690131 [Mycena leptocephala]|nr:hypothetical protein B0H13DRAFT_2690131 [Mycena leptocephala]